MNTNFNIIIDESKKTFHIEESVGKSVSFLNVEQKYQSTIENLKKIEKILKENMKYEAGYNDAYSKLSKAKLYEKLREKANDIDITFKESSSKLFSVTQNYFDIGNKQRQVVKAHDRIEYFFQPPRALELPNDVIQEMLQYLTPKELNELSTLNRHAQQQVLLSRVRDIKSLGYNGGDPKEAAKYLKELSSQLQSLSRSYATDSAFSDKSYLLKINPKLSPIEMLKKFQTTLDHETLLEIFSDRSIYSERYNLLKPFLLNILASSKVPWGGLQTLKSEALTTAIKMGDKETVKSLLELGVDPNLPYEAKSLFGYDRPWETIIYPLHSAVEKDDPEMVSLLLEHGAKVDLPGHKGITPLMLACGYVYDTSNRASLCNSDVVAVLLHHGADPNVVTAGTLISPLLLAAQAGDAKAAKVLLDSGANIDRPNIKGQTALHIACGAVEIPLTDPTNVVKELLDHGANPDILDSENKNPLNYAEENRLSKAAKLISSKLEEEAG